MALTRAFKDTVQARVARDPAFGQALLTEGINALLEGDLDTGKAVLRDDINATGGSTPWPQRPGRRPRA